MHKLAKSILSEDDDFDEEIDTETLETADQFNVLEQQADALGIDLTDEMVEIYDDYLAKNKAYKDQANTMNIGNAAALSKYFQLYDDLKNTKLAKAMQLRNGISELLKEMKIQQSKNRLLLAQNIKNGEGSISEIVQQTTYQWVGKSMKTVFKRLQNLGYTGLKYFAYTVFAILSFGVIWKMVKAKDKTDFVTNPNNGPVLDFAQLSEEICPVHSVMSYASNLVDETTDVMLFDHALIGDEDAFWRPYTGAEIDNTTFVGKVSEYYGVDNSTFQKLTSVPLNFAAMNNQANTVARIESGISRTNVRIDAARLATRKIRNEMVRSVAVVVGSTIAATGAAMTGGASIPVTTAAVTAFTTASSKEFGSGLLNRLYSYLPGIAADTVYAGAKLTAEEIVINAKETYRKYVSQTIFETEQSYLANVLISYVLIGGIKLILKSEKRTMLCTALGVVDKAYMLCNYANLFLTLTGLVAADVVIEKGAGVINSFVGLTSMGGTGSWLLMFFLQLHGISFIKEAIQDIWDQSATALNKLVSLCLAKEKLKKKIKDTTNREEIEKLKKQLVLKNEEIKEYEQKYLKLKDQYKKPEQKENEIENIFEEKVPKVGDRVGVKNTDGSIVQGKITKLLKSGKFSVLLDTGKRKYPKIDKIVQLSRAKPVQLKF